MSSSIPTLGYPSKIDAAHALHQEGKTTDEIAMMILETPRNVASLVSRGRSKNGTSQRRVNIPYDLYRSLEPHAQRRDVSVTDLVVKMLELTVEDNMVDAVLDDGVSS